MVRIQTHIDTEYVYKESTWQYIAQILQILHFLTQYILYSYVRSPHYLYVGEVGTRFEYF
jgi:hypothetical protein